MTNVQANLSSIGMFAWGGPGTMADNTVSYCSDAISANHSKGIQFLHNTVTNSASGIHTDNSGDGGGVADLIQGNTVTDGPPTATGSGPSFPTWRRRGGQHHYELRCGPLRLGPGGGGDAHLPAQHRHPHRSAAGSAGAYITTDTIGWGYRDIAVDFQNNTISGFETGIYLTADPQSWNPGPYAPLTINATFFNNNIYDNTAGMSMGAQGTYDVTANCNWWGSATGPYNATLNPAGLGNSVDGRAFFVPGPPRRHRAIPAGAVHPSSRASQIWRRARRAGSRSPTRGLRRPRATTSTRTAHGW